MSCALSALLSVSATCDSIGQDFPLCVCCTGIPPNVGFCFSFPVEQLALNSGKLVQWNKGFNVSGVIGEDVVALLSGAADAQRAETLHMGRFVEACKVGLL